MAENHRRHESPGIALLIVVAALALMAGTGTRIIDLHLLVGRWLLHHWISWAGALFIAVFTPAFYVLKQRKRNSYSVLLRVHVFGGLAAASLVSLHFTHHVTRPAEFYPDLGTGVVLFAAMALSVITGLLMRYRIAAGGMREWRLIHTGSAVTFYLTIGVHVLQGLGVL